MINIYKHTVLFIRLLFVDIIFFIEFISYLVLYMRRTYTHFLLLEMLFLPAALALIQSAAGGRLFGQGSVHAPQLCHLL